MTIKELRAQIRQVTMDINKRLVEYYEDGKRVKVLDREIDYLKDISGTSAGKTFLSMNTHRKNKAALTAQLSQLRQFEKWDIYTPTARREKEATARRAYKTYKRNTGTRMKFKTYNKAVTIVGALGQKIVEIFGSDQVIEMVTEALRSGRKPGEIIDAFEKVIKANKGKAKSPEDYIDDWYSMIQLGD